MPFLPDIFWIVVFTLVAVGSFVGVVALVLERQYILAEVAFVCCVLIVIATFHVRQFNEDGTIVWMLGLATIVPLFFAPLLSRRTVGRGNVGSRPRRAAASRILRYTYPFALVLLGINVITVPGSPHEKPYALLVRPLAGLILVLMGVLDWKARRREEKGGEG